MASDKNETVKTFCFTKEEYICKTLELLAKERDAEIEESRLQREHVSLVELQRRGVSLLKLVVRDRTSGLYGRTVISFTHRPHLATLPSHSITPGDIVGIYLSSENSRQIASGLVSRCDASTLSVAFDDATERVTFSDDYSYNITKLANDVTYKRFKRALSWLGSHSPSSSSDLSNVLFSQSPPASLAPPQSGFCSADVNYLNLELDESQKEAVQLALRIRDVGIIHGPPGTGKTTTVVEIVRQSVTRKLKLLVCAPSNVAVDNLVERLATHKVQLVRLGHPARVMPHIQKYSLDAIVSNSDGCQIVSDVKADIDRTLTRLHKTNNKGSKQALRTELSNLRKEMRQRETAALREVMTRVDVVLATLTSADDGGPMKYLPHVDLVLIDECSQALEVACWIALQHGPKCILVGDHLQLPPTIVSLEAAEAGLGLTLMERLLHCHSDSIKCTLTTQYRMHRDIMQWASRELYQGRLLAHRSVEAHLLRDIAGVDDNEDTATPLLLIDTASCELTEQIMEDELSKGNEGEADVVAAHVERLITGGVSPRDIAVISPYNLQVENLRARLAMKYPSLEIKSVDGFQGREKEAVIISMVRSNNKGEVGFLADRRRINVAVTRARRHLAVVCDSECVRHDAFIASLVDYIGEKGEVRSAIEYIADPPVTSHSQDKVEKVGTCKERKVQPRSKTKPKVDRELRQQHDMRQAELKEQLEQFISDTSRTHYVFPSTLTLRDRFILHELSERLGLNHKSYGEGSNRHIEVTKAAKDNDVSGTNAISDCSGSGSDGGKESRIDESNGITVCDKVSLNDEACVDIKNDLQDNNKTIPCRADSQTNEKTSSDEVILIDKSCSEIKNDHRKYDEGVVCGVDSQINDKKLKDKTSLTQCIVEGKSKNEIESRCANQRELGENVARVEGSLVTSDIFDGTRGANTSDGRCGVCGKVVPVNNMTMHEMHCGRKRNKKKVVTLKDANAVRKTRQTDAISKVEGDDFDALINAAMASNNKCAYKKCKESVSLMGQLCRFCGLTFCLRHHMAEVHGCGEAVRVYSRQTIVRDGVLHQAPSKGNSTTKQAALKKQMDKKLTEMSNKRKGQKHQK